MLMDAPGVIRKFVSFAMVNPSPNVKLLPVPVHSIEEPLSIWKDNFLQSMGPLTLKFPLFKANVMFSGVRKMLLSR